MRLKSGQKLGPYKIIRFIARGGMGEIYEAFEQRLERRVALKIISSRHEEAESYRLNLIKEARALAKVNHSNVVSIYSIDSLEGIDFIAMEFIDGIPLDQITEKFAFETSEVLDICMQMLIGIKALHDRNIVHRDIKPSNILLTDQGVIKWADFGLAAVLDQVSKDTVSNLYGTPRYLSPEQLDGIATSFPSDIWCLGLVFYELFAGEKLIDPGKTMNLLEIEEFIKELNFQVPLHLKRSIHPVLQNILKQMLSKDIQGRYKSIDDVISDFKQVEAKYAKERKLKIFSILRSSLEDYSSGWKILSQNTRINDYQKKRLMTVSLRFIGQEVSNGDSTVEIGQVAKKLNYFTKPSIDSAQDLVNKQIQMQIEKQNGISGDSSDTLRIFPHNETGRPLVDAFEISSEGSSFKKKFFKFYLGLTVVMGLMVLFVPKEKIVMNVKRISGDILYSQPELVREIGEQVLTKRELANLPDKNYPSNVTVWFSPGDEIEFQFKSFIFEKEGVLEVSEDAQMKRIIHKEVVNRNKFFLRWSLPGLFYWRIRSFDMARRTKIFKFSAARISPPELLIPSEGSRFVISKNSGSNIKRVHFFWKKKKHVENYEIQIGKSAKFTGSSLKVSKILPPVQSWETGLSPGIYYWRVRVVEPTSSAPWSPPRKFDIVTQNF